MLKQSILATAVIAGGIGLASLSAQALTIPAQSPPVLDSASYQPAAYGIAGKMRYNPAIHGNRCRQHLGLCVHYHDGYYYERTWWMVGMPVQGTGIWIYDSHRHGQRFRHRLHGFGYYYGGYYYSRPWWTMAPGITIRLN